MRIRVSSFFASIAIALCLSGCAGDFNVEKTVYPCRAQADCVMGYVCHPTRYVCVPAPDGGVEDASSG